MGRIFLISVIGGIAMYLLNSVLGIDSLFRGANMMWQKLVMAASYMFWGAMLGIAIVRNP